MKKIYNKLSNLKIPKTLKWVLFIPISWIIYLASTFAVYLAITFLFHFIGGLHWYFFIPAIFPAFILLVFIAGGLWSCFYIGLSFSPNRTLCWLLTAWLTFLAFSSIPGYCAPIPLLKDEVIIQLPCWAYITLQSYVVISLIVAAIFVNKNLKKQIN